MDGLIRIDVKSSGLRKLRKQALVMGVGFIRLMAVIQGRGKLIQEVDDVGKGR